MNTVANAPQASQPIVTQTKALRRVLVVDDSRVQRRIVSSALKKWGYEITEAESGEEALRICQEAEHDFILSDWVMPGMSGLEFCRAFRALDSEQYGYFILLTSKSDKEDVAEGLDSGADDYLSKPINPSELRARMDAGERILRMERELSSKNKIIGETLAELQRVYDEIDRDLVQAKNIQNSLVPELTREFGKCRVSLLMKPCGHVGGDLVGMFSPGADRLGFYSIDVSGHGITSAMMTARVSGYLSSEFRDQNVAMQRRFDKFYALRPPVDVARLLNERLTLDASVVEYFTMVYASVDQRTGRVRMVQAGHPHPLVIRANGDTEFLGDGGVPIGLVPQVEYDDFETTLCDGDRLLLYSDGITECITKNGEMLEPEGLLELVRDMPGSVSGTEFLDDLYWRLTQIMDPVRGLDDDVSAALLEFNRNA